MGGLTVAKTLHDNGYTNLKIIEGTSRIGGRIKRADVDGTTVESGAMWIPGKGTNPIYQLLQEYDVSVQDELPLDDTFRDKYGQDITREARQVGRRFDEAWFTQSLDAKAERAQTNEDTTMAAAFRYRNWNPVTELEEAVEAYYIGFETGASPKQISHKMGLDYDFLYKQHGDDTWMAVNDPRGYEYMVQQYANSFLEEDDDRIVFNKVVNEIRDLDNGYVEVLTEDGDIFNGDYVVSTVSVGVLQSGLIKHSPGLPDWKLKAIMKVEMVSWNGIFLKFPTMFWDNTTFLVFPFEEPGRHCVWTNLNHMIPGSNILQLSSWGVHAQEIARMSEKAAVRSVVKSLQRAYPEVDIPIPEHYHINKYTYDRLFMGNWPIYVPGLTDDDVASIQQPVGRMFFSGDYTNRTDHGYVDGTYRSSLRVADQIMACLSGMCKEEQGDSFRQFG